MLFHTLFFAAMLFRRFAAYATDFDFMPPLVSCHAIFLCRCFDADICADFSAIDDATPDAFDAADVF